MPDNKKQERSNKAMTFLSAFLQPRQERFWLWISAFIAGALPFITDGFGCTAHTLGNGWCKFHDVLARPSALSAAAGSPLSWVRKKPDDPRYPVRRRFAVLRCGA